MGVTVQIGDDTRDLSSVSESWIQDQIGRRKRDNQAVCVVINVKAAGADLRLATQACGSSGGGGGRPPNYREQEIITLWNEKNLSAGDFSGGQLFSFLQHLRRLV